MNPPAKQEMQVQSLSLEDPMEEEMAGYSPRGLNPPQYSCLGNGNGQRSLVGHSPWGRKRVRHKSAAKQRQS